MYVAIMSESCHMGVGSEVVEEQKQNYKDNVSRTIVQPESSAEPESGNRTVRLSGSVLLHLFLL